MLRSEYDRTAIYKQMRINGLLYQGLAPSEIPENLFEFGEAPQGSPYSDMEKMLKGSLFIDKKDFVCAEKIFAECIENENLIPIYINECKCELLFCKIINHAPENEIDSLYDKNLQNYIKASGKTQIAKKRLMYAYYLIYKKDSENAEKEYQSAMAMCETYPAAGELKSELSVIEYVKSANN